MPTHFIRRLNMREQLIRQVEIVPIEVVVRNVAAGSLSKRLGIEEGTQLPRTIIEYYYKDDALGDPMIADEHIACFGWASQEEMHDIADMAIRVNDFLSRHVRRRSASAWSTSSSSSAAIWDNDYAPRSSSPTRSAPTAAACGTSTTNEKLDKDRFRQDLGGEVEAYQEVARRLGLLPEDEDTPCSTSTSTARSGANDALPRPGGSAIERAMSAQANAMKTRVYVTLKNGVLDPQGRAIHHALEGARLRRRAGRPRRQADRARGRRRRHRRRDRRRCAASCSPTP